MVKKLNSVDTEQAMLVQTLALARRHAATIVAFGPARARILPHLDADAEADDIEDAMSSALSACPDGGTVLVSPMFPLTPEQREVAAGLA